MLRFAEFMTSFYWLLLPEFVLGNLRRGRWRTAYDRHGPVGLAGEFAGNLFGVNAVPLYVPIDGAWNGDGIKRLLQSHGIDMWGWGFAFNEMFFHVHRDDAWDAQQILLAAGVELRG